MGDVRYERSYARLRDAKDRTAEIRALSDDEVISALAAASQEHDPFLANVLATEAHNRITRKERVFASMGDAVIVSKWPERVIIDVNPAAERMLGWSAEDLKGQPTEIMHVDHSHYEALGDIIREGPARTESHQCEFELARRNGDVFPGELTITMIRNPMGDAVGVLTIVRDISDRKVAEADLRESQERYRIMTEHAAIGVALVSLDGVFLYVNDALADFIGRTPDELLSLTFEGITHPADLELSRRMVRQLIDGDIGTLDMEKRYLRKDGQVVWARLTAALIRNAHGQPTQILSQVQDITARKVAEARLKAQNGVATILADASTKAEVIQRSMQVLCNTLGWDVGEYWQVDHESHALRRAEETYGRYVSNEVARQASPALMLEKEEGAPRGIWAATESATVESLASEPTSKERAAAKAGPRSAFGIPVPVASRLEGVLMLLGREARVLDEDIRAALPALGEQIGQRLERLEAQGELQKLATVVEQSDDMVLVTDATGRIEYVNGSFERTTGYSLEEVRGKTPRLLRSGAHPASKYKVLWSTVLAGKTFRGEFINRRKDGTLYHEDKTITPLKDASGKITHFVSTAKNVTDRKEAEAKAARMTRLWSVLAEANEAIFRAPDRATLYRDVCDIVVRSGGFRMAWVGMLDKTTGAVTPLETAGHVDGYLDIVRVGTDAATGVGPTGTAIRTQQNVLCDDIANDPRMGPWREEALRRGYRASGAFPILVNGRAVGALNVYAGETDAFKANEARLLTNLASDIGVAIANIERQESRDRAEERLQKATLELERRITERTRMLQEANAELEDFAHRVSHDLRAPLRGLSYFVETLKAEKGPALDDEAREWIDRSLREAARMRTLIEDLLRFSRSQSMPLVRTRVDIARLAADAVERLRSRDPTRRVDVVIDSPPLFAEADSSLLSIVLENLVGNAWKFTAKTPAPKIEIGTHEQADGTRIFHVKDNGAGFPSEQAHRLFKVFQRLHSSAEFEGTGVGLATVARIIQRHGGRVWAEGAPGEGATISFTLPTESPGIGAQQQKTDDEHPDGDEKRPPGEAA